jgi:hypothetical protein
MAILGPMHRTCEINSCTLPEILQKVQEGQLLRDLMTQYGFSE